MSGTTTTNLLISNVQTNDAGSYQLVVTNDYGSVTSAVATLTLLVPPDIVAQPGNQSVLLSNNVSFVASVAGTAPLIEQWYFNGSPLLDGGRVLGSSTTNLTILNVHTNDAGSYQLVVTNNYGSGTSTVAMLTVIFPVQITQQPASESVLLGSNTTFSVTATGSEPLAYHWYFNGTPLSDGGRISGSTTPTLNISNVQSSDAGGYVAVITNLLSSTTSQTASLTPQAVLGPSVRYVNLNNPNPAPPYLNWSTAATNIQDAVDASVNSDLVLVSNGVYESGMVDAYFARVAVDKAITVQSVNGPSVTVIEGGEYPGPAYSIYSRCIYLTNGANLYGFTLTNGYTAWGSTSARASIADSGGGAFCAGSGAVVSNCVFTSNHAWYGGGAFGGTLVNCVFTNNAAESGGGACSNTLLGCVLYHNQALTNGGGAFGSSLSGCLLSSNSGSSPP